MEGAGPFITSSIVHFGIGFICLPRLCLPGARRWGVQPAAGEALSPFDVPAAKGGDVTLDESARCSAAYCPKQLQLDLPPVPCEVTAGALIQAAVHRLDRILGKAGLGGLESQAVGKVDIYRDG